MKRVALICALLGAPAARAMPPDYAGFLGGYGCTLAADVLVAAEQGGLDPAALRAAVEAYLEQGQARREGVFVVLDAEVCQIRLPKIDSPWSVSDPEIVAVTTPIDHFAEEFGEYGCFLTALGEEFESWHRAGRPDTDFRDYIRFLASGILSGEIRFFGPEPFFTPVGFQVMAGECARVPNAAEIARSHTFLTDANFDEYIRAVGAGTSCDARMIDPNAAMITARQQGAADGSEPAQEINAWQWFEMDFIAMAAGWRVGMTWREKGQLRPPLCHYEAGLE
ncbi:MAG: hypothetical protein CR993_05900 [Rhodobacterales bacterium]|nr:MAG: hypothetical protein CR993_05900 [Rhodobacterales bacterium]